MNFDTNTLSTLMQLFANKSAVEKQNNDSQDGTFKKNERQNTRYANAFEMQNGIGDKVTLNYENAENSKSQNQNSNNQQTNSMQALIEMMTNKNPMINNMLSILNSNKDTNMLAPLLAMMSSKAQTSNSDSTHNMKNERSNQADCQKQSEQANCNNPINKHIFDKNKTQLKLFAPIAFAGYNLTSILCRLYLSTR